MHDRYNAQFLDHLKRTGEAYDDAGATYGVRIQPLDVAAGEVYWRVIGVHHLTPEENQFNHHIYIEALDEAGKRVTEPPAWAGWTWEGRGPDEEARPQPLDKNILEPAGNIPVHAGQVITIWINGTAPSASDKSERVTNLHTAHGDERAANGELWNSTFHHSYYVVFQRTRKALAGHAEPGSGQGSTGSGVPPTGQPGQPLPAGATVTFVAEPATVAAGQAATLRWDVEGADKVSLAVTGHETFIVRPTTTTTYTLNVRFRDGSTRAFEAKVAVTGATQPDQPGPAQGDTPPAGATRPPTVRLSQENIAHLRTFPRPQNDNGRGLHFHLDLAPGTIRKTVERLGIIGAKWTLIYAPDELQTEAACRACVQAGIMPVIRIAKKVDEVFDPEPFVTAMLRAGAAPYVQIFNEPSDNREWEELVDGNRPPDWLGIFARRWAHLAERVANAGGFPGLQVLTKEELDAAIDAAGPHSKIWQRAFYCVHNYALNHPPDYPYADGRTAANDTNSILSFLAFAQWMHERLGFVPPIIGGEGGWQFDNGDDKTFPRVDDALHARYHREAFEWFRTGVLSNGEPLPDYLFSFTPWLVGGWNTSEDWWDGPSGERKATIKAVSEIPPFVRKFSWDR